MVSVCPGKISSACATIAGMYHVSPLCNLTPFALFLFWCQRSSIISRGLVVGTKLDIFGSFRGEAL
jgi:hypothetical protein